MPDRISRAACRLRSALLLLVLAAAGPVGAREAANPTKALLVMDIQDGYVGAYSDAQAFLARVNRVIDATKGKVLTIYVLDNGGGDLDERLHVVSRTRFTKTSSDAFTSLDLVRFLERKGIRDVTLVGLDAAHCVHDTAVGALQHGYRVHAVPDAVITRYGDPRAALENLAKLGVELVKDDAI